MRQLKTLVAATVLLFAAVLVAWLVLSPEAGDEAGYVVAREQNPFGLYSPGTIEELPPDSGRLLIDTLRLGSVSDYQDYTLGLVEELGISWVRLDFLYDGGDFIVPEVYLGKLAANDIEVIGCPRSFVPIGPEDLQAYTDRLGELVADHPEITVWQIDNEPSIGGNSIDSYLEVFLAGRRAVSEQCPECRIALAGVPVLDPSRQASLDYYDDLLAAIAAHREGEEQPFDIFDLHYYGLAGESNELQAAYDDYRELLDSHGLATGVSFWMTECATYAGMPSFPLGLPAQSEEQQAGELVTRFVSFIGAGGERVAWARFYENHNYAGVEDGYYDYSGLVYNGLGAEAERGVVAGTRKPAFTAYGVLVEELDGYSGVLQLAAGQYRFDFNDGRKPVYVAWAVQDTELADELRGPVAVTTLDGFTYEDISLDLAQVPVFVKKR